jgi:hypothetical protein
VQQLHRMQDLFIVHQHVMSFAAAKLSQRETYGEFEPRKP